MNATLRQQTPEQLESALRRGLRLKLGPFVIEYRGRTRGLARRLLQHYPDYPLVSHETFADARLGAIPRPAGIGCPPG